jgi:hypothetical protein
MEMSAHTVTKSYMRELKHVFPSVNLDKVIVIPTMQCSRQDLVQIGDRIEEEKDRLLEQVCSFIWKLNLTYPLTSFLRRNVHQFMSFAQDLCKEFIAMGYWADYIDPCSGLAVSTGIQGIENNLPILPFHSLTLKEFGVTDIKTM